MSAGPSVRRIRVDGRELVAKSATGARRANLRREAEISTCLAGSGVVELVALRESDDRTDLVTEFAGDHDLSDRRPLDPATLRRALATAVAALERLHDRGWSHGAICAEHVVVDRSGTSTLCSLGSARRIDAINAAEDTEQLRRVLRHVVERPDPTWDVHERSQWRRWSRSVRRAIDETDDLAGLRAALSGGDGPARATWRPEAPPRRTVAAMGAVVLLVGGVWALTLQRGEVAATRVPVTSARGDGRSPATTESSSDPSRPGGADDCTEPVDPAVDPTHDIEGDGCPDLVEVEENVVRTAEATFRVGDPGDDLRVGDWDCDGVSTVLLLRPDSGEVFEFDWAERNRPTTGRLVTVVDDATALSSGPGPDGCDEALVQRRSGPPVDPRLEHPAPADRAPDVQVPGGRPAGSAAPGSLEPPADGGTP